MLKSLNAHSAVTFKKRRFLYGDKLYELDAASPETGDIRIGIDVKRIEARRDIHKLADEIVNKAAKLKAVHPGSLFAAVIYYPFITEQINVRERLRSEHVDHVVFAGSSESSIEDARSARQFSDRYTSRLLSRSTRHTTRTPSAVTTQSRVRCRRFVRKKCGSSTMRASPVSDQ